ncbi:hypothetical protein OKW28_008545 [Paraburkholderia sp. 40]
MNFGQESRVHHDAMLSLQPREPRGFAAFWLCLNTLIS